MRTFVEIGAADRKGELHTRARRAGLARILVRGQSVTRAKTAAAARRRPRRDRAGGVGPDRHTCSHCSPNRACRTSPTCSSSTSTAPTSGSRAVAFARISTPYRRRRVQRRVSARQVLDTEEPALPHGGFGRHVPASRQPRHALSRSRPAAVTGSSRASGAVPTPFSCATTWSPPRISIDARSTPCTGPCWSAPPAIGHPTHVEPDCPRLSESELAQVRVGDTAHHHAPADRHRSSSACSLASRTPRVTA